MEKQLTGNDRPLHLAKENDKTILASSMQTKDWFPDCRKRQSDAVSDRDSSCTRPRHRSYSYRYEVLLGLTYYISFPKAMNSSNLY